MNKRQFEQQKDAMGLASDLTLKQYQQKYGFDTLLSEQDYEQNSLLSQQAARQNLGNQVQLRGLADPSQLNKVPKSTIKPNSFVKPDIRSSLSPSARANSLPNIKVSDARQEVVQRKRRVNPNPRKLTTEMLNARRPSSGPGLVGVQGASRIAPNSVKFLKIGESLA